MIYADEISIACGVLESDVLHFCYQHSIAIDQQGGRHVFISDHDGHLVKNILGHPKFRTKMLAFRGHYGTRLREDHPELIEYLCYHDLLDIFCWMLKIRYSTKEVVKSKKYRLDVLFDNFLEESQYDTKKLGRLVGTNPSQDKVIFHLKKGWYNELARSYPLDSGMLNIGTNVSDKITEGKSLSWNVTQTYYAVYEYVNALVFTNSNTTNTERHKATTNLFESGMRKRFTSGLLKYPFTITSPLEKTLNDLRPQKKDFWDFLYARCPRDQSKSIFDLENDYVSALSDDQNFIAFLYDFRVWANYVGIESLIEVQNGYLLAYLYRNLGTVSFFYGGFAELMAIALLGEQQVIEILAEMTEKYILKQDNFINNQYLVPVFIRFRFYQKHGLINSNIDYLLPPKTDPIVI